VRFLLFRHSIESDWNHGNAHFLRGVVTELQARGHRVDVLEPACGWSRTNLLAERGEAAFGEFRAAFPSLRGTLLRSGDARPRAPARRCRVAAHLEALTETSARALGAAARRRVLAEHTYAHRAALVDAILDGAVSVAAAMETGRSL
jgi:spore maturation protein CgeB